MCVKWLIRMYLDKLLLSLEYCNTLQHTATHCTTLHHTTQHYTTLQHTATHRSKLLLSLRLRFSAWAMTRLCVWDMTVCDMCVKHDSVMCERQDSFMCVTRFIQHTAAATQCNTHHTLQHTTTHTPHCNTWQHTATHCNTYVRRDSFVCVFAQYCNITLQHTATHTPHCITLQHTATHMCDAIYSCATWHNTVLLAAKNSKDWTWLGHVCDMTHSYMSSHNAALFPKKQKNRCETEPHTNRLQFHWEKDALLVNEW